MAAACIAVDLLTVGSEGFGILRVLIVKCVLFSYVEVEVLLLTGTVTFHEVHTLVGLLSPGVEVEGEVTVAQVPKLETRGEVEANCDANRQQPGYLHVGYIKEG